MLRLRPFSFPDWRWRSRRPASGYNLRSNYVPVCRLRLAFGKFIRVSGIRIVPARACLGTWQGQKAGAESRLPRSQVKHQTTVATIATVSTIVVTCSSSTPHLPSHTERPRLSRLGCVPGRTDPVGDNSLARSHTLSPETSKTSSSPPPRLSRSGVPPLATPRQRHGQGALINFRLSLGNADAPIAISIVICSAVRSERPSPRPAHRLSSLAP